MRHVASHEARLVRRFDCAPEDLFAGWSDPELLKAWFMADWGERASADFREGGSYRIEGRTPKGTPVVCHGRFLRIDERGLDCTFEWEGVIGDPDSVIPESDATPLEFRVRRVDGKTEVTLVHGRLDSDLSALGHRSAWDHCLGILAESLRARAR